MFFLRILEDRKRKTEMAPPGVPGKKKKTVDNKKALSKGFGGIKVKGKSITKNEVIKKKSKKALLIFQDLFRNFSRNHS